MAVINSAMDASRLAQSFKTTCSQLEINNYLSGEGLVHGRFWTDSMLLIDGWQCLLLQGLAYSSIF